MTKFTWRSFFLLFILILGVQKSYAVCMTELDGELYQCLRISERSADQWCSKKFGSEFKAYYTTDACSKSLASTLRGENKQIQDDDGGTVKAVCLSYEQGQKLGCEYYEFIKAERYCSENFGPRYLAFIEKGSCTEKKAARLRGDISPKNLISGLESKIKEIEAGLTMVDKEGIEGIGVFYKNTPNLGNNFYTKVIKTIMAKMRVVRDELYKKSHYDIPKTNRYASKFVTYNLRYLRSLTRLYKLYAYVAHKNHKVLKTYKFSNLDYLKLKVQKDYGLELMSKANFMSKTIDNGNSIEIEISQQDKQSFEYAAVSMPVNKEDYAKYLTFVGSRELLTNTWALDRLHRNKVQTGHINSCGNGFLSIRAQKSGDMRSTPLYRELLETDAFFDEYISHWEELSQTTRGVSLLDDQSAKRLIKNLFYGVKEIKNLLEVGSGLDSFQEAAEVMSSEDAPYLVLAENDDWDAFSEQYFRTVIMPGDGVLNKEKIIKRILEEVYSRRSKTIAETFLSFYSSISDKAIAETEIKIYKFLNENVKLSWERDLSRRLRNVLSDYNDPRATVERRKREFMDRHMKVVEEFAHAAKVKLNLSQTKKLPRDHVFLDPSDTTTLFAFFEGHLVSTDFKLKNTIETKEYGKEVFKYFKDEVNNRFSEKIWPYVQSGEMKLSNIQRQRILRRILVEVGRDLVKKYNLTLRDYTLEDHRYRRVVQDNTRVTTQRYRDIYVVPNRDRVIQPRNEYVSQDRSRETRTRVDANINPYQIDSSGNIYDEKGKSLGRGILEFQVFRNTAQLEHSHLMNTQNKMNLPSGWLQKNKEDYTLSSKKKVVLHLLKVFNLEVYTQLNNSSKAIGFTANNYLKQKALSEQLVSQAFEYAPLLKHLTEYKVKTGYINGGGYVRSRSTYDKKKVSYIEKIADLAVDSKIRVNQSKAKSIVEEALAQSHRNMGGKLEKFCEANYLDYKDDDKFKSVFHTSAYLRQILKLNYSSDMYYTQKLERMDEEIRKEIRSWWEAANEDWIDPIAQVTGTIAIVATLILLVVSSGGTALPGVVGLGMGALGSFVAIEFYVAFPFVASSALNRLNQNFIEIPQQLKVQESLASSMIDHSEVTNWNFIKETRKGHRLNQAITAVTLPLDIWYGKAVTKSIRRSLGITGVKAHNRLTGNKLRFWSTKPKSMLINRDYAKLRKKHGIFRARLMKAGDAVRNLRMMQPRYQPLSEASIKVATLRQGLIRRAKSLNLHSNPWKMTNDIETYAKKMRERLTEHSRFVDKDGKLVRQFKLKGRLTLKEATSHQFQKSAITFIPKSFYDHLISKKLPTFYRNYGKIWEKLKLIQGKVIVHKYQKLQKVLSKLDHAKVSGQLDGHNSMFEKFLSTLTHDEILVLEEVVRKAKGPMRGFKQTFKDYNEVIASLRPSTYLYGHIGEKFKQVYPQEMIIGEKFTRHYAYKNPTEDIVNYYESMMKQNAFLESEEWVIRREIEELLSDRFRVSNGKRTYLRDN